MVDGWGIIINLISNLLIRCLAATHTDFNCLENVVFCLILLFLLTTGSLGELY